MSTLNATLVDKPIVKDIVLDGEVVGSVESTSYGGWHACLQVKTDEGIYPISELIQGHGDTPEAALEASFIESIEGYENIVEKMKSLKARMYRADKEVEQ